MVLCPPHRPPLALRKLSTGRHVVFDPHNLARPTEKDPIDLVIPSQAHLAVALPSPIPTVKFGAIVANPLTLGSPTHVVIGATDLDASIDWWAGLGFGITTENTLDSEVADALFGLAGEVEQIELCVDEAPGGAIWLVQTPQVRRSKGTYDPGLNAVGLYTTDMEASLALAEDLGALRGGRSEYDQSGVAVEERSVVGPDGSIVVFVALGDRHPSVLDIHPEWLHSEIHSIISTVGAVDSSNRFWSEQMGLTIAADDFDIGLDALARLPQALRTRRSSFCDEFINPIRYEFLEFSDVYNGATKDGPGASSSVGMVSTWPLPPAVPLACFSVVDVAASAALMFRAGATFGDIVELGEGCAIGGTKAAWGLDPNGVRFILAGH
jgi:hypothetical protein